METFTFDKEKYLRIMKSEGVSAALNQLHRDTIHWEYQAFEGKDGHQPEMWKELHKARNFSRELWDLSLEKDHS